jgi:hypothetical protein
MSERIKNNKQEPVVDISIEGFTSVEAEQEICAWCERLNCKTLQHMRTFDPKTPFDPQMVLCLTGTYDKPVAWTDPAKRERKANERTKCDRCWNWTPFAPVCNRCAGALVMIFNMG